MDYLIPLIPVRDTVLFPRNYLTLSLEGEGEFSLLEHSLKKGRRIGVVLIREGEEEKTKGMPFLNRTLTSARVLFENGNGNGKRQICLEGIERVVLVEEVRKLPFRIGRVRPILEEVNLFHRDRTMEAMEELAEMAEKIVANLQDPPRGLRNMVDRYQHPSIVADVITGGLIKDAYAKQSILSERDIDRRLKLVRVQLVTLMNQMQIWNKTD